MKQLYGLHIGFVVAFLVFAVLFILTHSRGERS